MCIKLPSLTKGKLRAKLWKSLTYTIENHLLHCVIITFFQNAVLQLGCKSPIAKQQLSRQQKGEVSKSCIINTAPRWAPFSFVTKWFKNATLGVLKILQAPVQDCECIGPNSKSQDSSQVNISTSKGAKQLRAVLYYAHVCVLCFFCAWCSFCWQFVCGRGRAMHISEKAPTPGACAYGRVWS